MIPFRTEIIQGVVVNVSGLKWSFVGTIVTAIIVVGKCTALFIEQESCKLPVQVVLYEHPQVIIGRAAFDPGHKVSELFKKIIPHKVIYHAPA